mmetsp:Transcript_103923/g.179038  ORF Transcript_103923/g.179038 Transcript_103923/m.179038 type:complete len:227 (-) Transcript_103923:395-1075(-)
MNSSGQGSCSAPPYLRMMGSHALCRISSMPSMEAHGRSPLSGSATITSGVSCLSLIQSKTLPGPWAQASFMRSRHCDTLRCSSRRACALPRATTPSYWSTTSASDGTGGKPLQYGGSRSLRAGASSCSHRSSLSHRLQADRQHSCTCWVGDSRCRALKAPAWGSGWVARTAFLPHRMTVRRAPSTPATLMRGVVRAPPPLVTLAGPWSTSWIMAEVPRPRFTVGGI